MISYPFNSNYQWNLIAKHPIAEPSKIGLNGEETPGQHDSNWCSKLGCLFCGFLVREDCCNNEPGEEDALFCTLCNAEVQERPR